MSDMFFGNLFEVPKAALLRVRISFGIQLIW